MRYRYRARITRPNPGGGTQDPETGVFTPSGAATVILDCECIAQDSGQTVSRNASGMPWLQADSTWIVPRRVRDQLLSVEPDDNAELFYPNSDRKAEGNVKMVREFENALDVVYR